MSLSSAAIKRPVTTISAVLALVLLGAVSITQMPVSLLPDVALPVLTWLNPNAAVLNSDSLTLTVNGSN